MRPLLFKCFFAYHKISDRIMYKYLKLLTIKAFNTWSNNFMKRFLLSLHLLLGLQASCSFADQGTTLDESCLSSRIHKSFVNAIDNVEENVLQAIHEKKEAFTKENTLKAAQDALKTCNHTLDTIPAKQALLYAAGIGLYLKYPRVFGKTIYTALSALRNTVRFSYEPSFVFKDLLKTRAHMNAHKEVQRLQSKLLKLDPQALDTPGQKLTRVLQQSKEYLLGKPAQTIPVRIIGQDGWLTTQYIELPAVPGKWSKRAVA